MATPENGSEDDRFAVIVSRAGHPIDHLHLDELMHRHWPERLVKNEPARTWSTWFDYRHRHPAARAQYFYQTFLGSSVSTAGKLYHLEKRYSPILPLKRDLYHLPQMGLSTIIGLMHLVDELSIPYGLFFEKAYEHWMQERAYAHEWRGKLGGTLSRDLLPPPRLLMDGECMIAVRTAFERRCLSSVIMPSEPTYLASNWTGAPAQQDWEEWVCNQVLQRPQINHEAILRSLVHDRDRLRIEAVGRRFGDGMRDKVARAT